MPEHAVGTREQWLSARKELLGAEKEHSRRGDELARRRRELPWVRIEKAYTFETAQGKKTLADLFDGLGTRPAGLLGLPCAGSDAAAG